MGGSSEIFAEIRSKSRSREAVEARRERRSDGEGRGRKAVSTKFEVVADCCRGSSEENIGDGVRGKSS